MFVCIFGWVSCVTLIWGASNLWENGNLVNIFLGSTTTQSMMAYLIKNYQRNAAGSLKSDIQAYCKKIWKVILFLLCMQLQIHLLYCKICLHAYLWCTVLKCLAKMYQLKSYLFVWWGQMINFENCCCRHSLKKKILFYRHTNDYVD